MEPEALDALRRNSHITMDRDGVLHFEGRRVENPRVRALFHRGVAVRDDGEVTLTVGKMWAYITCEGVARFVDGLRLGARPPEARLRGGATRALTGALVGYAPDGRFYLWLSGERGPALAGRAVHATLAGAIDPGDPGDAVALAGERLPLVELATPPRADTPAPWGAAA